MFILVVLLVLSIVFAVMGFFQNSAKYVALSVLLLIVALVVKFGGLIR